jgi:peptidyl-prolyl cis-trans isomerase B (cyclophilin B)
MLRLMKTAFYTCLFGVALALGAGCKKEEAASAGASAPATSKTESKTVSNNTNDVAILKTTAGEMVVEFWPDVAPKTVENFKKLARSGFYDGTCFHRIIKGFMIQGGDPLTKDPSKEAAWGTGDPGYKLDAEFNSRSHQRGVLSMARAQDPNSAGCQFFICLGDASFLDRQYTAFGKLIKGDEVLGKIGDTPVTASGGGEASKPTARVNLDSVKIVPANTVN